MRGNAQQVANAGVPREFWQHQRREFSTRHVIPQQRPIVAFPAVERVELVPQIAIEHRITQQAVGGHMPAAFRLDELFDNQLAALEGAKRFELSVFEKFREKLVAALKFFER